MRATGSVICVMVSVRWYSQEIGPTRDIGARINNLGKALRSFRTEINTRECTRADIGRDKVRLLGQMEPHTLETS